MPIPQLNRHNRSYGNIDKPDSTTPVFDAPRRPKSHWLKKLVLTVLIGGVVLFITGTAVVAWVSRDLPDPNHLTERQVAQSTKIYDRTGQHLLYEVFQNQKRTLVNLDQISPWASKATIAVEDKHFYEHNGVQLLSILRAGFNNLIGRKTGGGGASTLTQQLIKNALVGDEHSIFRKIKEAILALRLERAYSKDEILKLYLNEIPYGSTNYGIEAASQSYFHKSAKDLTLPEAATLAALPKAPSFYLNDLNALRDRRDTVLRLMFEQGYISGAEKTVAQNSALRLYHNNGIMAAPHFVLYVKKLLADQFGEKTVDTGGLKVITSLDYDKQLAAEKIVKENGDKFAKEANANNAALVAVDPKNGQILALVGSRDFENDAIDGQFDVAILGRRQPGSSFKPFVYTAAFEKGYTPETILYDVTTNFEKRTDGSFYTPKNFDGKEHGLVTLRKALQGSLNIPAVKTLYLVGSANAIDFAKRFGYTTLTGDYGLSLVLGGAEVNLLEHTNAYATLADNGAYHTPVSILKVTDDTGATLSEWKEAPGIEAVKPELAATISGVLTDDNARQFMFGPHSTLTLPDRPVAAKTGTTNDNKDAWTMGYVPSLTVGVWVGNTIPSPMKSGGSHLAGVIWNQFMRVALKDTLAEQFPVPPPNDATKPVLRGDNDGIRLPIDTATGRIASSSTPLNLIEYKVFLPPHDILYYVKKDDPAGPAPETPADDPQYQNWEDALQDWVKRTEASGQTLVFTEPPTDGEQTVSTTSAGLAPNLEVTYPTDNQTVSTRQLELTIKASAPRGVYQVSYEIDGINIGATKDFPFSLSYYAQTLSRGPHSLKVIAEDDLGNTTAKEVSFNLAVDPDSPSFEWFDATPLTVKAEDFPRAFYLTPWRWEDTKEIKIVLSGSNLNKTIYTFNHAEDKLFDNKLLFTWKHSPGKGSFTLTGTLTDNTGKTVTKVLDIVVQ